MLYAAQSNTVIDAEIAEKSGFQTGGQMNSNTRIPLDIAAEKSHTTTINLLMHIKRGLLPAEEHNGRWFISEADLSAFISENRKAEPGEICVHKGCGKGCGSCAED